MSETYHFQVNLGGMLDVLSNHLYKTADVFLRELMQNGVDAITLRKKRQPCWSDGRISIQLKTGKQMIFKDNGAGLNKEEIHQFLSVIGQSSKQDLENEEQITEPKQSLENGKQIAEFKQDLENEEQIEDYIGRFGIGLLSCFMVSDSIVVHTKPMDGSQAYIWTGNPDGTYTLEPFEKAQIGTSISLTAKAGCEQYFCIDKIISLTRYYGLTLPVPIYLEGKTEPLNQIPADFSYINRGQLLSFGEWLFEEEFLDAIPIETPHLSGAAYILPYQTDVSIKKGHRIYLKHMLLTEQGSPLLPDWAFFLRCFLNTSNLRPTASRENFYENEELALATKEFSNAVKHYFRELCRNNSKVLQQIVNVHFEAIKSMAVWDDEIFRLFIDYLPFSTSYGELTGAALKKVGEAVYIDDISRFKQLKPIFHAQNRLLICTGYNFDCKLIPKLAQMYSLPIIPLQEENMELVLEEITFQERQEAFAFLRAINLGLKDFDCQAELRHFYPVDLPALYYISDDVQFLRQVQNAQETSSGIFSEALSSLLSGVAKNPLSTLYLNRNNALIQRLLYLKNEKMLQSVAKILYIYALITGGHSPHREELKTFSQELLYIIDYNENFKKFKIIGGTDEK